jgi:hypothetical protein
MSCFYMCCKLCVIYHVRYQTQYWCHQRLQLDLATNSIRLMRNSSLLLAFGSLLVVIIVVVVVLRYLARLRSAPARVDRRPRRAAREELPPMGNPLLQQRRPEVVVDDDDDDDAEGAAAKRRSNKPLTKAKLEKLQRKEAAREYFWAMERERDLRLEQQEEEEERLAATRKKERAREAAVLLELKQRRQEEDAEVARRIRDREARAAEQAAREHAKLLEMRDLILASASGVLELKLLATRLGVTVKWLLDHIATLESEGATLESEGVLTGVVGKKRTKSFMECHAIILPQRSRTRRLHSCHCRADYTARTVCTNQRSLHSRAVHSGSQWHADAR